MRCLGNVEARGRFIEQQQRRPRHYRPRDLQQAAVSISKRAGTGMGKAGKTDELQHCHRSIADDELLAAVARRRQDRVEKSGAHLRMQADLNILERGHLAEQLEVLKGATNSSACALGRRMLRDIPRAKAQRPAADPIHSGNQIEQRGLAGAVGSDQAVHACAARREVNGIDGQQAAEASAHAARLEQPRAIVRGRAHRAASLPGGSLGAERIATALTRRPNVAKSAASPPSPNSMVAIRIAPNTSIR